MPQTYFAILTATGEAKDANAKALGVPLVITEMAVGDGNGVLPVPDRTRVALVNQVRRAQLNQLSRDPVNTNQVIAEQVIPENVGGWWIREIGLYDEDGDLIAIANCPPTYKPQLAEGSGRTQVVRMVLIVSSADSVQLKIDPAIVLATRKYADDAITASMNAHLAAADPHPQYMTSAETTQAIQSAQATEVLNGSAKIATQAKTDAGTDDATIVTPKKLFSSFQAKTGVRTGDASSRGMVRLTYPDGAYYSGSSIVTGAFKIAFPDGSQAYNSMVRMRVEVWDYGLDKSMTLLIAGYVTSNLAWSNQTVTILGQKADRDFTVRFGNDGTKPCIWIGELASDWGHPRVYIAELMASYNADGGTLSRWYSGWSIALVTAFDTVEDTITSNLVFAKSDISSVSGLQDALDAKEPTIAAGTTAQYWRGDKTWQDLFAQVRAATLTGLSTASGLAIAATDTVLSAIGKLQKQITDLVTTVGTKSPIASPTFTGTPNAPTAAAGTNTTQLATTAFVQAAAATVTATNDASFADNSAKPASTSWVRGAMTTLTAAAGFASNFSSNGYIKLPSWLGGFIIQWGVATTSAGGTVVVTFPLAFPTGQLRNYATLLATIVNSPYIVGTNDGSSTQITIYACTGAGAGVSIIAKWFAVGR